MDENEQVEALRRWWVQNGKFVLIVLVAVIAGVLGWRQWQMSQEAGARAASDAYQGLLDQLQDPAKALDTGRALVAAYPESEYAVLASLAMGAAAVEQNDLDGAAAHLRFAMNNAEAPGTRQVAALRLGRVLLAQQKAQEAQQVLDAVPAEGFAGEFDELRGDIQLSLGDRAAARAAYQQALAGYADASSRSKLLQMKLDDLADATGGGK